MIGSPSRSYRSATLRLPLHKHETEREHERPQRTRRQASTREPSGKGELTSEGVVNLQHEVGQVCARLASPLLRKRAVVLPHASTRSTDAALDSA